MHERQQTTHMKSKTFSTVLTIVAFLMAIGSSPSPVGAGVYFGHLHNHSSISDGGSANSPEIAYSTARNNGLDFFGLSDHAEQISADPNEFDAMKAAADNANVPGEFTTFWGFEWSHSTYGHITVVNPRGYTGSDDAATNTFAEFMQWLDLNGSGVAFFNHPGRQNSTGVEFEHFTGAFSSNIVGIELWNKSDLFDDYYFNSGYTNPTPDTDRSGYYDEALQNGWMIGASGSEDNHSGTWGASSNRLAIIAGSNTRADLLGALTAGSFYSTLDDNLILSFTIDGQPMGSSVTGGLNNCVIEVYDADGSSFSQIQLIRNGNIEREWISFADSTHPVVICDDLYTADGDYLYCTVAKSGTGNVATAISSPIYISGVGPDGPPRASLITPLDNGPSDLEPTSGSVLVNTTQSSFKIQLIDLDGIDDSTASDPGTVSMTKSSAAVNYTFAYDTATDVITLSAPTGTEFADGTYDIILSPSTAPIMDTLATPMSTTSLTVEIDTSIVVPTTLSFQDGAGWYNTETRMLCQNTNDLYGVDYIITADTTDTTTGTSQVLLRFDNIIGTAADQIPDYASITSATLRLRSLDQGNGGYLYPMLQPWSSADTWSSFDNGIQANDVEASSLADDGVGSNSAQTDVDLNVTDTVQKWVDSAMDNNGWVILPGGADGWDIASALYSITHYRPELIVTFVEGSRPLVADAGGDQTISDDDNSLDESVVLDGSGSYHPDGLDIISYVWTVDDVSVPDPEGDGIVTVTLGIGTHSATLSVTDSDGTSAIDTVTITVNQNVNPTANAGDDQTVYDTDGDAKEWVTLDGSTSDDTDGSIMSFQWMIDGTSVADSDSTPNDGIITVELELGTHTATLEVTDNGGATDTDAVTISVEVPSLLSEGFESGGFAANGWIASAQASVETTSALTGTYGALLKKSSSIETTVDTGGLTSVTITYWARTAGLKDGAEFLYVECDGTGSQTLATLTGTSEYAQYGPYNLEVSGSLRIRFSTDGGGGNDLAMIDNILITGGSGGGTTNTAPTASFTYTASELSVSFTDSSVDLDGNIVSWSWAFGDGATSTSQSPSHNYAAAGTYSVTLTVTDDDGATGTMSQDVTVSGTPTNDPPTAGFTYTASGLSVSFTDSSVDPDGYIVSWSWAFGDGATSTSQSPSHNYAAAGTYSVTLTVTDDGGETSSDEVVITVTDSTLDTVSVSSINVTVIEAKKCYAVASVTIAPGQPDATVYGDWYVKGVLRESGVSAPTDDNGLAELRSLSTPAKTGDEFMFVVTDIDLTGFAYDSSANAETQDSDTVE